MVSRKRKRIFFAIPFRHVIKVGEKVGGTTVMMPCRGQVDHDNNGRCHQGGGGGKGEFRSFVIKTWQEGWWHYMMMSSRGRFAMTTMVDVNKEKEFCSFIIKIKKEKIIIIERW